MYHYNCAPHILLQLRGAWQVTAVKVRDASIQGIRKASSSDENYRYHQEDERRDGQEAMSAAPPKK
jgi:hypothetical protein